MGESYREMKERQSAEFNSFPLGAAFSDEQFDKMMKKWGLSPEDTDKIVSLGAGCFIRKSDVDAFRNITKRFKEELENAISADTTGGGFIKDMFYYELCNHEYSYTMDPEDALNALGYSADDIIADERLKKGFCLAEEEARKVGWE